MVDPGWRGAGQRALAQAHQTVGQISGPGGLSALVIDDIQGVLDGLQLDHGPDEIAPPAPYSHAVRTTWPRSGRVRSTACSPTSLVRP